MFSKDSCVISAVLRLVERKKKTSLSSCVVSWQNLPFECSPERLYLSQPASAPHPRLVGGLRGGGEEVWSRQSWHSHTPQSDLTSCQVAAAAGAGADMELTDPTPVFLVLSLLSLLTQQTVLAGEARQTKRN